MNIHPGAFRVKIQPAARDEADETQLPSLDGTKTKKVRGASTERGIIVEIGPGVIEDADDSERWGFVQEGAVVYYKGGFVIDNYVFIEVNVDTIIAVEGED